MQPGHNIFNVAPGRPFLEALAQAILAGDLPSPSGAKPDLLDLPAITILLPTRRAARALQAAFLKAGSGRAMLLQAIRPISETAEDQSLIESFSFALEQGPLAADLPPAIGKLERQLVLTRLVMAWSGSMRRGEDDAEADLAPVVAAGAGTPAQAAHLAHELASLMDAVATENVALEQLAGLVPDNHSAHWQQTLEFLKIITEFWPLHLAERGLLAPMERRNRLILDEAERLRARPPKAPVIVAGVTGSIPATGELMRAVLASPMGAIVLPGLDQGLDDPSWQLIRDDHAEHPQFGLRQLLERLELTRADVRELPGTALAPARAARNRLVSEALRPTGTLAGWRTYAAATDKTGITAGLRGVSLLEAASAEDEAEAIALILREVAETPGRTAALVSPDRLLARRVGIRLESWGIRVDDSAGRPFGKTVPGSFLDLVINAWATHFAPAELMALLKHPLTRLGLPAGHVRRAARNLEIAAFRTPYLGSGLASLDIAVERARQAILGRERRGRSVNLISERDFAEMRDLVQRVIKAFAPLAALSDARQASPLAGLCAAHVAVAEAIAEPAAVTSSPSGPHSRGEGRGEAARSTPGEARQRAHEQAAAPHPNPLPAQVQGAGRGSSEVAQTSPLWHGEAGEAAWTIFEALTDAQAPAPDLAPADYPDFYRTLVAGEAVRPRVPVHPRLSIWGPYEARLQQPDVIVLGSLNEGTWPKAADPGAWLNRPMRKQLGLPSPEEEIGRAAHDVTTLLGADTVILTRADKVDGEPRVPSRWLLRLKALLAGVKLDDALAPSTPWLGWARARDHVAGGHVPVKPPEPRPPLALRPRRMSVSDVETWIANPYAIFARHVLHLEPLSALGLAPGPQEKGQIIHEALSQFTRKHPDTLPPDIVKSFLAAAADVIADYKAEPRVRAFWLPRLARFAEWFAATERERRKGVTAILAEVSAKHSLATGGRPFELRARADRIDAGPAGLIITDYKTGQIPPDTAVRSGQAPQLPLEAALAIAGAFAGTGTSSTVAGLRYIRATGAEPPGEERIVNLKDADVAQIAAAAMNGLHRLIQRFDDPNTAYRALRRPRFNYDYDGYAHLARVGEWSVDEQEEGER